MNAIAKKLLSPVYYFFVERYAFAEDISLWDKILYSLRFRLTDFGILLSQNEKKLASLKNKHAGKRCFIIGNGPSLNKLDLTYLKDEFTFGVNAIYMNYEKMGFYPNFYVVEDDLVANDRKDEINAFHGADHKFFGVCFSNLFTHDNETIWLNVIRNFDDEFNKKVDFPLFSTNSLRRLYVCGTVTYLCLQLAYYMGFEEVYMVGFDHNYIIPKSAIISNEKKGGFDILSTEDDPNHFHPGYFGKGYSWHDPRVDRMELGFKKAKVFFERDGRKVYNATAGGHLEVFDRIDYGSIFRK